MVIDVAVPTAVYYLLRHYGLGVIAASSLSGVAPVARSAYSWRRTGRPDLVAVAMVTALVAGTLAAVLMNSARLVLAKAASYRPARCVDAHHAGATPAVHARRRHRHRDSQTGRARWPGVGGAVGCRSTVPAWHSGGDGRVGVALVLDAVVRGTTGPPAAAT